MLDVIANWMPLLNFAVLILLLMLWRNDIRTVREFLKEAHDTFALIKGWTQLGQCHINDYRDTITTAKDASVKAAETVERLPGMIDKIPEVITRRLAEVGPPK